MNVSRGERRTQTSPSERVDVPQLFSPSRPLLFPRLERDVQPGGEDHVILLLARRRIGHIDVAKLILPSQSLADLGYGAKGKGPAILPRVREIGEKVQRLRQH